MRKYILIITSIFVLISCLKQELAKVKTIKEYLITNNSVKISGQITNDGGTGIISKGICLSTSQTPTISDLYINDSSLNLNFEVEFMNLNVNQNYYAKAYVENKFGFSFGDQITVNISNLNTISVFTYNISSITNNSAVCGGNISSDASPTVTQRGICWSTNTNPTIEDNITNNGTGLGSFTSLLSSLNFNTTYYARAYATNGIVTTYGNQNTFTTPMPKAILVGSNNCSSLSGITSLYFTASGLNGPWGLSNTGYSGTCWAAPDPIISSSSTIGGNNYVQFDRNFVSQGYIEFWIKTYKAGYKNLIPVISVNGASIGNATMVGGQSSSFYWMKVRSPIIHSGYNTIRVLMGSNYHELKVDEIEFYEYN